MYTWPKKYFHTGLIPVVLQQLVSIYLDYYNMFNSWKLYRVPKVSKQVTLVTGVEIFCSLADFCFFVYISYEEIKNLPKKVQQKKFYFIDLQYFGFIASLKSAAMQSETSLQTSEWLPNIYYLQLYGMFCQMFSLAALLCVKFIQEGKQRAEIVWHIG